MDVSNAVLHFVGSTTFKTKSMKAKVMRIKPTRSKKKAKAKRTANAATSLAHLAVKKVPSFFLLSPARFLRTSWIKIITARTAMTIPHNKGRKAGPGCAQVPKLYAKDPKMMAMEPANHAQLLILSYPMITLLLSAPPLNVGNHNFNFSNLRMNSINLSSGTVVEIRM